MPACKLKVQHHMAEQRIRGICVTLRSPGLSASTENGETKTKQKRRKQVPGRISVNINEKCVCSITNRCCSYVATRQPGGAASLLITP